MDNKKIEKQKDMVTKDDDTDRSEIQYHEDDYETVFSSLSFSCNNSEEDNDSTNEDNSNANDTNNDDTNDDDEEFYDDNLHRLVDNYESNITDTLYTALRNPDNLFPSEERAALAKDIFAHVEKMIKNTNNMSTYENFINNRELLINNKLLLAYFVLNDKYFPFGKKYNYDFANYIKCNSIFRCTIADFLRLRYILQYGNSSLESYDKNSKKKTLANICNTIEKSGEKSEIPLFVDYVKLYKTYLNNVIGVFIDGGLKNFNFKYSSQNITKKSTLILSCLECSLLNFILETYDSDNCVNFRNKKFDQVDDYYLEILIVGILTFIKFHDDNNQRDLKKIIESRIIAIKRGRLIDTNLYEFQDNIKTFSENVRVLKKLFSEINNKFFINVSMNVAAQIG